MSRRWRGRIARSALLLGVLAISMGSGAFAYWAVAGSGSGSARTGTSSALTISPATPVAALRPASSSAVTLTITNSNPSPAKIGSLALDTSFGSGGYAVDSGHSGCSVAALTYTTQTNGGAGWTVPAKVGATDGSLAVTLPAALAMSSNAASACQGATFTIYLTAGP